jgi:hypothetical protein
MENTLSFKDKVRLTGVSSKESGAWLKVLPASSLGTLLDNYSFRVAISLRLGTLSCHPHVCPCGAALDNSGSHGLSCRLCAGRRSRHGAVNSLIHRALVSAGMPSILEPQGTSRYDGKRPDGMTLIP